RRGRRDLAGHGRPEERLGPDAVPALPLRAEGRRPRRRPRPEEPRRVGRPGPARAPRARGGRGARAAAQPDLRPPAIASAQAPETARSPRERAPSATSPFRTIRSTVLQAVAHRVAARRAARVAAEVVGQGLAL